MTHRAPSVLCAALLLVAQLLLGVMSAGAATHAGAQHCGGCPDAQSSGMSHDLGSGADDCGFHCSHDGSTGTQHQGCSAHCAMAGSNRCGYQVNQALTANSLLASIVASGHFPLDRRSVDLPDSPLFDLLRPPTRG